MAGSDVGEHPLGFRVVHHGLAAHRIKTVDLADYVLLRAGIQSCALLVVLALTIIVSLQLVGIVLVAALLVTPAAAAAQLTKRFIPMMLLSAGFGIFSAVGGLYASYQLQASSGATIVLLATLLFFASLGVKAVRTRAARNSSP